MAISLIDPFMNPEAHKIIGELETYSKTVRSMSLHDTTQASAFLAFEAGRLQAILAEEQAKSAEILERHTRRLITLTWALVWLTMCLLAFTIYLAVSH